MKNTNEFTDIRDFTKNRCELNNKFEEEFPAIFNSANGIPCTKCGFENCKWRVGLRPPIKLPHVVKKERLKYLLVTVFLVFYLYQIIKEIFPD